MLLFYVADARAFMSALLKTELFDSFEVRGVSVKTFTSFEISCAREDSVTLEKTGKIEYCAWGAVRDYVFGLVKGKIPPKYIRILLCFGGEKAEAIHSNAAALHLTVTYESGRISVLTGAAQKAFSLEKDADNAWDTHIIKLFAENRIETRESAE